MLPVINELILPNGVNLILNNSLMSLTDLYISGYSPPFFLNKGTFRLVSSPPGPCLRLEKMQWSSRGIGLNCNRSQQILQYLCEIYLLTYVCLPNLTFESITGNPLVMSCISRKQSGLWFTTTQIIWACIKKCELHNKAIFAFIYSL